MYLLIAVIFSPKPRLLVLLFQMYGVEEALRPNLGHSIRLTLSLNECFSYSTKKSRSE